MTRWLPTALAAPLLFSVLASEALGQGAHLVSGGGFQAFPTIQGAVDAAPDGGVVLITGGAGAALSSFTVDGKGLSLFALPQGGVPITSFASTLIRNQVLG